MVIEPSPRPGENRVLIVEDDQDIAQMLVEMLSENGLRASIAPNGSDLDRHLKMAGADLVLLDAMLPGEDGFSICRRLRSSSTIPILMLTARSDDIDRIVGLELGADDYVTKPFNSRELLARIKGLLRRANGASEVQPKTASLSFAGWTINLAQRQLTDPDGVEISMTTAEFDILWALCCNPGRVMTRDELLALTHAGAAGPVQRSVDVHVSRVRQKVEPNPKDPTFIKTVRLGGYLFTPTVDVKR